MRAEDLEIQSLLVATAWSLQRTDFHRVWSVCRVVSQRLPNLRQPYRSGAVVEYWAGRRLGADSCVPQALTMVALLRRHGHGGYLVLGTSRSDLESPLRAHAWVELHGTPVVGGAERPAYRPIWRQPF